MCVSECVCVCVFVYTSNMYILICMHSQMHACRTTGRGGGGKAVPAES